LCFLLKTQVHVKSITYKKLEHRVLEKELQISLCEGQFGKGVVREDLPALVLWTLEGLTVTSTHGSPWCYDTFVPVIFAGAGVQQARVNRAVTPYDIAPTLSDYLGVKPPSGAIGAPLLEVSENR
jgi:hypothetical protein